VPSVFSGTRSVIGPQSIYFAAGAAAGAAGAGAGAAAGGAGGTTGVGVTVTPFAFICSMYLPATLSCATASCSFAFLVASSAFRLLLRRGRLLFLRQLRQFAQAAEVSTAPSSSTISLFIRSLL
jgi:hypothetical protein